MPMIPECTMSMNTWSAPLTALTFAVLDFETTGLHPERGDQICEIGLVKLHVGEKRIVHELSELVNPQRSIPHSAYQVHGITDDMVRDKPTLDKILPKLLTRLSGSVVAVYNAPFEFSFLYRALRKAGLPHLRGLGIDVLELARQMRCSNYGYKLETVARALQISPIQTHRALADAELTARILYVLIQQLLNRQLNTLMHLYRRFGERVVFNLSSPPPRT